jgi:hypothetical protein
LVELQSLGEVEERLKIAERNRGSFEELKFRSISSIALCSLGFSFRQLLHQLSPDHLHQNLITAVRADQILSSLVKPAFMMASFQHPFQSLKLVKRQSHGIPNVLVASAGAYIYSYAAESGKRLAVWPQHVETSRAAVSGPTSTLEDQAPPEKRIKLSSPENESGNKPSTTTDHKNSLAWTNIPVVLATSDGKHVVTLTAEDKCIRVFSLSEDGKFTELSSR